MDGWPGSRVGRNVLAYQLRNVVRNRCGRAGAGLGCVGMSEPVGDARHGGQVVALGQGCHRAARRVPTDDDVGDAQDGDGVMLAATPSGAPGA
jgi:hypothetical protein